MKAQPLRRDPANEHPTLVRRIGRLAIEPYRGQEALLVLHRNEHW